MGRVLNDEIIRRHALGRWERKVAGQSATGRIVSMAVPNVGASASHCRVLLTFGTVQRRKWAPKIYGVRKRSFCKVDIRETNSEENEHFSEFNNSIAPSQVHCSYYYYYYCNYNCYYIGKQKNKHATNNCRWSLHCFLCSLAVACDGQKMPPTVGTDHWPATRILCNYKHCAVVSCVLSNNYRSHTLTFATINTCLFLSFSLCCYQSASPLSPPFFTIDAPIFRKSLMSRPLNIDDNSCKLLLFTLQLPFSFTSPFLARRIFSSFLKCVKIRQISSSSSSSSSS